MLVATQWRCMGGRGPIGSNGTCSTLWRISGHSPRYPQSNWTLLVLLPEWVGLCTFWDPVGLSNELSCEAGNFSHCCLTPHRCFQSVVWGFISPGWSPGLCGLSPGPPAAASLASCSFAHPASQSTTSLGLPAAAPPTGMDECFFFISLVVGLP